MNQVISKLYKLLLGNEITQEIEDSGDLTENQYGFRKEKATAQALDNMVKTVRRNKEGTWEMKKKVALITLDVKNAFNTLR